MQVLPEVGFWCYLHMTSGAVEVLIARQSNELHYRKLKRNRKVGTIIVV